MTDAMKQELMGIGVDLNEVMERFMGNEALLERFLKKFPLDENFRKMEEAVATGDCQGAFTACHTLKGVTGNLSLKSLFDLVKIQVEFFRAGDFEKGAEMMPRIKEVYDQICDTIARIYPD